jgi:predicted Zn-dependent protease
MATALGLSLSACAVLSPKPPAPAPGFDAAEAGASRTFLALSALREDKSDLPGALTAADKALAQQPRSRAAALRRAELLLAVDHQTGTNARSQEARETIDRAGAPEDGNALLAKARLAWNEGRRDDALALLRRASDALPQTAHPQCLIAVLVIEGGDAKGALAAAERALDVDGSSLCARRERARARLVLGNFRGAIEDTHGVLRESGDEVDARVLLATALERDGRTDDALRELAVLPAGTAGTGELRYRLALALDKAGEKTQAHDLAVEAAESAANVEPEPEWSRDARALATRLEQEKPKPAAPKSAKPKSPTPSTGAEETKATPPTADAEAKAKSSAAEASVTPAAPSGPH